MKPQEFTAEDLTKLSPSLLRYVEPVSRGTSQTALAVELRVDPSTVSAAIAKARAILGKPTRRRPRVRAMAVFTPEQLDVLTPQQRRAFELFAASTTVQDIAKTMGLHYNAVAGLLLRARRKLGAAESGDAVDDVSGERCRCGLRLPCNDCVPPIHHFASGRRGGAGGTEGNGLSAKGR